MVVIHGNVAMFQVHRPQASQAVAVGDIGCEETHECRMVRGPGGNWFACLPLTDGDRSFRYHADGQWLTEGGVAGAACIPDGLDSRFRVDCRQ